MEKFDKYDEIDYTGKSDPDIWETHIEFFFSKEAALRRYAEIKRLHPEESRKTQRPFFRATGDIEIHRDMIKDFKEGVTPGTADGVWQLEYWLPSTEKHAAEYESRMSAQDPKGWTEHRQRDKRLMNEPSDQTK